MVIADLNVGILYTFGIVSLGVYGIVLAGYAANSKYPFLGGIRSSAQMISYEIAMGMSVIPVFLLVGSLNLSDVIGTRPTGLASELDDLQTAAGVRHFPGGARSPKPTGCRSTCRKPSRNWPGGYNVEYSSMKFALFFMGEYAAMTLVSAMMVTLFSAAGRLPFFGLDQPATTLLGGLAAHRDFPGEDGVSS
jgi:NADH-quinone oxidoreductase subunit H